MFSEYEECFVWRCDGCGLTATCSPRSQGFWPCWDELKARGWRASRDGEGENGSWSHSCGNCVKKARKAIVAELFGKRG